MPDDTSRFIRACRGEPHDTIPVWFMRQAGRYQPSYRALRQRYSMLQLARTPELIRDITVRPVEDLGVDAAILFSDIMIPLASLGIDFDIQENVGPVVAQPVETRADVDALKPFDATDVDFVLEGVERTVSALNGVPLIGFSGAPFTLASYIVEGAPSRTYRRTKHMMWQEPDTFAMLMERLADMVIAYLKAQAAAGASALQIFDSWVGALSVADYRDSVLPHMVHIFSSLIELNLPLIYFGVGNQHLLEAMASTGASVLGIDWRTPLSQARTMLGPSITLQGNLDPERVTAGMDTAEQGAIDICRAMRGDPRFIFNLGHGVPKETDPAVLKHIVDRVHAMGGDGA
ncbi:uroporphyrinogen decarboxylase [Sulfobacillus harzensis]|uniref:Uroporphyrinogen decarboxylase n=1 Tax=Sulfobacillus harzensis TaxID=2729629 RepID=A0A7Y0L4K9_9FIRM|nr:uroporphyrinogen decarboxylase [Sulfobacillus harzensis]NMP23110.1 uroporphyrinogen decarboxylase [Sulfobacillus harzensis]